jgi:hypothetical protein
MPGAWHRRPRLKVPADDEASGDANFAGPALAVEVD